MAKPMGWVFLPEDQFVGDTKKRIEDLRLSEACMWDGDGILGYIIKQVHLERVRSSLPDIKIYPRFPLKANGEVYYAHILTTDTEKMRAEDFIPIPQAQGNETLNWYLDILKYSKLKRFYPKGIYLENAEGRTVTNVDPIGTLRIILGGGYLLNNVNTDATDVREYELDNQLVYVGRLPNLGEALKIGDVVIGRFIDKSTILLGISLYNANHGTKNLFLQALKLVEALMGEASVVDETAFAAEVEARAKEFDAVYQRRVTGQFDKDLTTIVSQIRDAEKALVEMHRRHGILQQKAEGGNIGIKALSDEILELRNHSMVSSLDVRGEEIKIVTKTVRVRHSVTKKVHEIGRLVIKLVDKENETTLRFSNLDRIMVGDQNRRIYHPHIFCEQAGSACFGNLDEQMPFLLGDREFGGALQLALEFIMHVDVFEKAGKFLSVYPVVDMPASIEQPLP